MRSLIILALTVAFATAAVNQSPSTAPVCAAEDWAIIASTVVQYTDIVNGKEVRKARAEAITPTTCTVTVTVPDSTKK